MQCIVSIASFVVRTVRYGTVRYSPEFVRFFLPNGPFSTPTTRRDVRRGLDWRSVSHTALDCIAWHWIGLDCIAWHCIALHCMALHCMALDCNGLHWIGLHGIGLHCMAWHCIAWHGMALDCMALPGSAPSNEYLFVPLTHPIQSPPTGRHQKQIGRRYRRRRRRSRRRCRRYRL